jgi:RNA polymerase sigma-70 factor (ECF subfamily)
MGGSHQTGLDGDEQVTQIDAQRLRQLIDAHGAALTLYARQWCRAPEDALQEALIELVRQTPVPDHPVAWLHKVVRRRAMNLARAEQRRAQHHRLAGEKRESWFLPPEGPLDESIDVEPILQQLPSLEREIVVARIWGELSFDQIANLVDRSTSSVHRRYHGALAQLERMINTKSASSRQADEPRTTVSGKS